MFYIKDNENKIVLFDENRGVLENTLEFMPQYKDFTILETKENEIIVDFQLMTIEEAEKQEEQAEKLRIAKLYLTAADVERGIYKAKGMDFDDILEFVIANPPKGLDVKALKIELKANNFYRGNPYVEAVGRLLGFTDQQLTRFFETNDYLYLTNCTLTIYPTPSEATVTINDVIGNSATVPYSTPIVWSVSAKGYKSQDGNLEIKQHTQLDIVLEKEEVLPDENSTDTTEPTVNADEVPTEGV